MFDFFKKKKEEKGVSDDAKFVVDEEDGDEEEDSAFLQSLKLNLSVLLSMLKARTSACKERWRKSWRMRL